MLHTLSCSPFGCSRWEHLLASIVPSDGVLLFQNGVVAGLQNSLPAKQLLGTGVTVYAVIADISARGLTQNMDQRIRRIDYSEFVALTVVYTPQWAW
ncbi:MAG: sulfurtransferase complex subunit TusB [Candidatus Symbiodolus clandestinus]